MFNKVLIATLAAVGTLTTAAPVPQADLSSALAPVEQILGGLLQGGGSAGASAGGSASASGASGSASASGLLGRRQDELLQPVEKILGGLLQGGGAGSALGKRQDEILQPVEQILGGLLQGGGAGSALGKRQDELLQPVEKILGGLLQGGGAGSALGKRQDELLQPVEKILGGLLQGGGSASGSASASGSTGLLGKRQDELLQPVEKILGGLLQGGGSASGSASASGSTGLLGKRQDELLQPVEKILGGLLQGGGAGSALGKRQDELLQPVEKILGGLLQGGSTGAVTKRHYTLESIIQGFSTNQDVQGALNSISQSGSDLDIEQVKSHISTIVAGVKSTKSQIQSADTNSDHSALGLLISGQLYNIILKLSPVLDKLGQGLGIEAILEPLDAELVGLVKAIEPLVAGIENTVTGLLTKLGLGPVGDLLHKALEQQIPLLLAKIDTGVLSKLSGVPVVGDLLSGLGL